MSYAYTTDQTTIDRRFRSLPAAHWIQDTPDAGHYEPLDSANANSYGYYLMDETAVKPADTPTTTWDRTVPYTIVAEPIYDDEEPPNQIGTIDVPKFVVTWVERPKTQDELDADADQAERDVVRNLIPKMTAIIDGTTSDTVVRQRKDIARLLRRVARDSLGD